MLGYIDVIDTADQGRKENLRRYCNRRSKLGWIGQAKWSLQTLTNDRAT